MNLLNHSRTPGPRFRRLLFPILVGGWLGLAAPAFPAEALLIGDATVAAKPQGTKPTLRVNDKQRAFVQFLLSPLPVGAHLEKATLRLWVVKVASPGSIRISSTGDGEAQEDENTLTEATAPAAGVALEKVVFAADDKGKFVTVDVTDYVRGLGVRPVSAPSFFLEQETADDGTSVTFDSKEARRPATSRCSRSSRGRSSRW